MAKGTWNIQTLASPILFLFCAISFFFSSDHKEALHALEIRLPLLVMPLVLFHLNFFEGRYFERVISVFIISSVVAAIVSFIGATIIFFKSPSNLESMESPFAYFALASTLNIHPGYLSVGVACASVFSINRIRLSLSWQNILLILISLLLLSFVLLLSTISVVIGLVFALLFLLIKKRKEIPLGIGIVILILASLIVMPASKYLEIKWRGISLLNDFSGDFSGNRFTPISGRYAKWYASAQMIKDHPFGVGIGDSQRILNEYYKKNGFTFGIIESFDPHNLWLSYSISCGVAAGILIATMFAVGWYGFAKLNLVEGQFFLIIFGVFSMTESTLSRNKGLFLFLFFFLLFNAYSQCKQLPKTRGSVI